MSGKDKAPGIWFNPHVPGGDRAAWERLLNDFETRLAQAVLACAPGHVDALQMLGAALTRLGRHEEALAADRELVRLAGDDPISHYNLACSLSNLRFVDEAFRSLQRAVELGYRDFRYLGKDPDLEHVRRDSRYATFLAEARAKVGRTGGSGPRG